MNSAAVKYDGQNKYIRITDIDENSHQYIDSEPVSPDGNLEEKYIVKNNDILFARTGASVGKTYLYNPKDGLLYFAGFLIRANIKEPNNSYFIFNQTLTERYKKWVLNTSMRSGQPGINSQEYGEYNIYYPSVLEQNKIADFLSFVDKRIEKQRQLVESLKKYKRGLFIQLYNQSSKNKIQIKNLGEYFSAGILSKDDLVENGSNPCILYGELFTKYNEVIQDICSFTNKSLTTKTQGTEILFPSSTTVDALSLICPSSINQSNVILGGDLFAIRLKKDFDNDFMSYLFNYIYKRLLAKFAQGITIVHLHYSDIKEQFIEVPNVDEQIKIIKIVNNIEKYILKNEKIHENLKSTKQGLLQQMFI